MCVNDYKQRLFQRFGFGSGSKYENFLIFFNICRRSKREGNTLILTGIHGLIIKPEADVEG